MISSTTLTLVSSGSPFTEPPAVSLKLAQGESATVTCTVKDSAGVVVDLTGGQLQFAARKRATSSPSISRQLTITDATNGVATLELAYDDTALLAVGSYVCDIWFTAASGKRYPVTGLSLLTLRPAMVTPGLAVTALPSQAPLAQGPPGESAADPETTYTEVVTPLCSPFVTNAGLTSEYALCCAFPVPAGATDFEIGLSNVVGSTGSAGSAIAGCDVAGGTPTVGLNDWSGSPTIVTGISVPDDGSVVWTSVGNLVRNAAGYVLGAWRIPAGGARTLAVQGQAGDLGWAWGYLRVGAGTLSNLSGMTATNGQTSFMVLRVDLRYKFSGRKVCIWGDSLGRGAAYGGIGDSPARAVATRGYAVSIPGYNGAQAAQWADDTKWWIQNPYAVKGHRVLIALGTNDVDQSATAATILGNLAKVIRNARTAGAEKIWLQTIVPWNGMGATKLGVLRTVNRVILSGAFDVDAIIDAAQTLTGGADEITASYLVGAVPAGNKVHWNASGNDALIATWPTD